MGVWNFPKGCQYWELRKFYKGNIWESTWVCFILEHNSKNGRIFLEKETLMDFGMNFLMILTWNLCKTFWSSVVGGRWPTSGCEEASPHHHPHSTHHHPPSAFNYHLKTQWIKVKHICKQCEEAFLTIIHHYHPLWGGSTVTIHGHWSFIVEY